MHRRGILKGMVNMSWERRELYYTVRLCRNPIMPERLSHLSRQALKENSGDLLNDQSAAPGVIHPRDRSGSISPSMKNR